MTVPNIEFSPPVIAHRGAPVCAPENSLQAFIAARNAGAAWIETDVKLTADGIPVLIHDDTLDRTTSGKGPVAEMAWTEMQKLDAGAWFSPNFSGAKVTSLAELVAFCSSSKMRLLLELKPSPGRTQATVMVALIEAAKLWPEDMPPPIITSFSTDALLIAAQLHPGWPRGLLLDTWHDNWIEAVERTESSLVTIKEEFLTPERLISLRNATVPVLAYTVNDPVRAKELLRNGIKAIYSDDPGLILK